MCYLAKAFVQYMIRVIIEMTFQNESMVIIHSQLFTQEQDTRSGILDLGLLWNQHKRCVFDGAVPDV